MLELMPLWHGEKHRDFMRRKAAFAGAG